MSDRASASAERLKQRRSELQTSSQKNLKDFKDRTSGAAKRASAKAAERKQMKDEIKSELSKEETDVSEADDYNQRDKELKKTSKARNQRFKDLHKATNTDSNEDVNEGKYDGCKCKGCGENPCKECGGNCHKLDEGRVARAVRDTIDKLPQGLPGGKRDRIRQAAVNAEIRDKKSKEKGTTTYQQWSDAVNASKKRNKG